MSTEELEFTASLNRMAVDFDLILSVSADGTVTGASGTIVNEVTEATADIAGLQDTFGESEASDGISRTPDQVFLAKSPYVDADGIGFEDSNGIAYDLIALPGRATGAFIVEQGSFEFVAFPANNLTLEANCFMAGTHISTPDGEVRVEDLAAGMLVQTISGDAKPIRWIGYRAVDCHRHPCPDKVNPVRVAAGALGAKLPWRDLFVSPDHAIFAEGVLIPVKHLINGTTITQLPVKAVVYYHIELEAHDVVFAEGLPAETYLDTGDRTSFANSDLPVELHPSWGSERQDVALLMDALGYVPLRVSGMEVEQLKARIAGSTPDLWSVR